MLFALLAGSPKFQDHDVGESVLVSVKVPNLFTVLNVKEAVGGGEVVTSSWNGVLAPMPLVAVKVTV